MRRRLREPEVAYEWHRSLEARPLVLSTLAFVTVAVGGLILLVPPYFLQGTIEPVPGVAPYTALELEGRDLYIREGCNTCHSQQVRPLKTETDRYGPFSLAGEGIYDRPFLWGSRRTGPDLARVGGKYPDSWHWLHLRDPRALEPHSNMPSFDFLTHEPLDTSLSSRKLAVLRRLGHPYRDAEVNDAAQQARAQAASVAASLRGDGLSLSEFEAQSAAIAVIAYLQRLGRDLDWRQREPRPVAAAVPEPHR
jgi:cytochrome c oxidase cbb3-type subunit I/II